VIDRVVDRESLRRVQEEQRILAGLEHSGIARLYDAGVSPSGQPYLAMEQVAGRNLIEHCRESDLPTADRLRLFLQVLSAVTYAHQRSVVHRDLKPGNILVNADGQAKLLDFGIARIVAEPGEEEETRTLHRAMTPGYASPEQLSGERVTVASDIYSLGVILRELSGGAISRDLEAVASKALRPEPDQRYRRVEDLADELRRVLAGSPVLARRDVGYRARSFVRRHRGVVTAAVGLLALAVALRLGAWSVPRPVDADRFPWGDVALGDQKLQEQFTRALALKEIYQGSAAAEILQRIVEARPDEVLVRTALVDALSVAGRNQESLREAEEAQRQVERRPARHSPEERLFVEALALRQRGDQVEAIRRLRSLSLLMPDNREVALQMVGALLHNDEAKAAAETLARWKDRAGEDPRWTVLQLSAFDRLGREHEVTGAARDAAAAASARAQPALAARLYHLEGGARNLLGDPEGAKAMLALLVEEARRSQEPRSLLFASMLSCMIALDTGRYADIETECGLAVERARGLGDAQTTATLLNGLGSSRRRRGQIQAARRTFAEGLEAAGVQGTSYLLPRLKHNLALVDLDLGRFEAAEAGLRGVVEMRRAAGDQRGLILTLRQLANTLLARGHLRDADKALSEAESLSLTSPGRTRAWVLYSRAQLETARAQDEAARAHYEESLALQASAGEPDAEPLIRATMVRNLERPQSADCTVQAHSAIALHDLGDANELPVRAALVRCWLAVGRIDRARSALEEAEAALGRSDSVSSRLEVEWSAVAVAIARQRHAEAQSGLDHLMAECRSLDYGSLLYDLRLVQVRLAKARGDSAERVKALLEALRDDARAQGFERIARRAELAHSAA
jgi:serine/threonine-protein kinase